MSRQEVHIKNKQEMVELAEKLAKSSKKGDVFGLAGTLGAGKSFFARGFINSFSDEVIEVSSPTFNLLNVYEIDDIVIYHFDLYRLKDPEELFNLGIEDALINGITLIEWPEIALDFLGKNYMQINIEIKDGDERVVKY